MRKKKGRPPRQQMCFAAAETLLCFIRKQYLPPWCTNILYPLKTNVSLENTQLPLYIGYSVSYCTLLLRE
jgi:hypothetical protein